MLDSVLASKIELKASYDTKNVYINIYNGNN